MGTSDKPEWGSPPRPAHVTIAMPVYDKPEHETVRALRILQKPHPKGANEGGLYGSHMYTETNGVLIEEARNAMVAEATSRVPGPTHVLFVDADMVFPADALKRLLKHDKDIVGGLYFNRRPPYAPIVMRANHASWHAEESLLGHVYNYPVGQLVEVDATGCGFLLVNVDVFASTYSGDPARPGWFDKLPGLSEDFSFCVRAIEKGHSVFVDTSLSLGHIGRVVVDEAFALHNRTQHPLPWRPGARPKPVEPSDIPTRARPPTTR